MSIQLPPNFSRQNDVDLSALIANLDLGSGEAFADIFNSVSSEDSELSSLLVQKPAEATEESKSDQKADFQKQVLSTEEKLDQKSDTTPEKLTQSLSSNGRPLTAAQLEKSIMQILPIVPQLISTTYAQFSSNPINTKHLYKLSERLPIPLDIAFESSQRGLKVTVYSEGGLFSALAANSDDLLKQLKKSLKRDDINLDIQKSVNLIEDSVPPVPQK